MRFIIFLHLIAQLFVIVKTESISRADFPERFIFGTASSAYQFEGAVDEGNKGDSIWDTFSKILGRILDFSNANMAVDQYHRFKEYAEIPAIWSDTFGNRVSEIAVLTYALKNRFNIFLSKFSNKLAFTTGLLKLFNHYNLRDGGWMRLFYLGGTEFHIEIMDRQLSVVTDYHQFPNNYDFGWKTNEKIEDEYNTDPDNDDGDYLTYCDLYLSASHIKTNKKALPVDLVRHAILPNKPKICVLRDQRRRRCFCEYYWTKRDKAECSLTTGWLDFVRANDLTEGDKIRFYINKNDPSLVHAYVLHE